MLTSRDFSAHCRPRFATPATGRPNLAAGIAKVAQLLGYDARAYKLFVFTLGGAIAGLAGCLFANWGSFTSPTVFGLAQSAQIIIWVIVGGRGTLIGPIVGCIGIQWLTTALGANQPSGGSGVWAAGSAFFTWWNSVGSRPKKFFFNSNPARPSAMPPLRISN